MNFLGNRELVRRLKPCDPWWTNQEPQFVSYFTFALHEKSGGQGRIWSVNHRFDTPGVRFVTFPPSGGAVELQEKHWGGAMFLFHL